MKFEQLLIATLNNSNEIREQAEFVIKQYKETNYQRFLFKLSKHILKTDNPISLYISLTIILQDIRSGKLFLDEELFNLFMPNFHSVLSQIFLSGKLNEATCNILSMILTSISVRFPETNIDQFLIISINQIPQFQCFFIDTLAMILFQSKNSTPFDVFISIFQLPNNIFNEYNSKILLLFSIIHHFPSNKEHIHLILSQFISNIPEESIKYVLHLYSLYIQLLKDFFEEYINETFAFITNCISTQNDLSIQAEAVDCITNISIAYKYSYEVIYYALSIILQMIETENDENIENESVLKESIHVISANSAPSIFLNALSNIQNEKKNQYSYLLALSEIHMCASFQMSNHVADYFDQVISFLNPDSLDKNFFRIKMAAFLAIENLCNIIGPNLQQEYSVHLFSFLYNQLANETNLHLFILNLRCLSIFLIKVKQEEIKQEVPSLFTFLIQILMNSKNDLVITEAINVIDNLSKSLSSSFIQFYPLIIQIINQINITDHIDLVVPVIRLCNVCISNINDIIQKDRNFESIEFLNKDEMIPLFLCALEMRNKVENESDFDFINEAIISFINFFGEKISSILISHVIPTFLCAASAEIEITHLPEGHGIQSVPGFVNVSPLDFAKLSTIQMIISALKTIYYSITILQSNFLPFAKVALQVVSNWITYQFHISNINDLSWLILDRLLIFFGNVKNDDTDIDTNVTFSLFLNSSSIDFNSDFPCMVLIKALKIGIERKCMNFDFMPKLFECFLLSLQNKLHQFFNRLSENDSEEDEDEDDNKFLENENKFFKFCLTNFPNITVPFFQQMVVPLIPEMIKSYKFLDFVIKVTTSYIIISQDLIIFNDFQAILFDSLSDIESETAQTAMKSIGNFLGQRNFTFPIDFYVISYQKMSEFLKDVISFENDSLLLYNETIISFTKLLYYHSDIFSLSNTEIDFNIGLRLWFDSIPKLLNNKKNSIVFNFLSFLISEKANEILELVGPAELIKLLLSNIGRDAVNEENEKVFISFIYHFISTKGNPFISNDRFQNVLLNESESLKLQKIMEKT